VNPDIDDGKSLHKTFTEPLSAVNPKYCATVPSELLESRKMFEIDTFSDANVRPSNVNDEVPVTPEPS
jgi:hypothetical protein